MEKTEKDYLKYFFDNINNRADGTKAISEMGKVELSRNLADCKILKIEQNYNSSIIPILNDIKKKYKFLDNDDIEYIHELYKSI